MISERASPAVVPANKMAMAIAVASKIQIHSIRLIETRAKWSPIGGKLPTNMEISVQTSPELDEREQAIRVCAAFKLLGRYKESDTGEAPLQIDAVFSIQYSLASTEGLGPENYSAFAELNGVHNAWPYWREYVQSIVVRMGLPPLTIPVYRVVPVASQQRESPPKVEKRTKAIKRKRKSSAE